MVQTNQNKLYYGDNLEILRKYVQDESVDLIYLDPPFNSSRDYNVLFKDEGGLDSQAQLLAFEDTWHWDKNAEATYQYLVTKTSPNVAKMIGALREFIGTNQMMAYIVMMTVRLAELHRVLKNSGSLYLHCDPTASHYLKIVLDTIFGIENFQNEIIWKRTSAKGNASRRLASNHDTIFKYSKSKEFVWHPQYIANDPEYIDKFYRHEEEETGRRYMLDNLANPNKNRPNLTYEFLGVIRVWRWTKERMEEAYKKGLIVQNKPGDVPRLKRYLDEQEGKPVDDIWIDITALQAHSKEMLGWASVDSSARPRKSASISLYSI